MKKEHRLCEVVLKRVAQLENAPVVQSFVPEDAEQHWPDWFRAFEFNDLHRPNPVVDYAGCLRSTKGIRAIGIEHTRVECFKGEYELARARFKLQEGLRKQTSGKLPAPGLYQFAADMMRGKGTHVSEQTIAAVAEWALRVAPNLVPPPDPRPFHANAFRRILENAPVGSYGPEDPPSDTNKSLRAADKVVPFDVRLTRIHDLDGSRVEGRLWVLLHLDEMPDWEAMAIKQAIKALTDKIPKLLNWNKHGFRSALVLEQETSGPYDPSAPIEALVMSLQGLEHRPDYVFVTRTMFYGQDDSIRVGWLYELLVPGRDTRFEPINYSEFSY